MIIEAVVIACGALVITARAVDVLAHLRMCRMTWVTGAVYVALPVWAWGVLAGALDGSDPAGWTDAIGVAAVAVLVHARRRRTLRRSELWAAR